MGPAPAVASVGASARRAFSSPDVPSPSHVGLTPRRSPAGHFAGFSAVCRSYTRAVVSWSETASRLPVRSKARWPPRRGRSIRPTSVPVAASHTHTRLGPSWTFDTTATRDPSGLYAIAGQFPSAVAVQSGLPDTRSHTETGYVGSIEVRTAPLGSFVCTGFPRPATASRFASGDSAT